MSNEFTATNVGHELTRHLAKYQGTGNTHATGIINPNSLHSNVPSVNDAMGISDGSGTVSFCHNEVAAKTFTIYYWSDKVAAWILLGPANTVYSISVDPLAAATFEIDACTPFFISASADITDLYVGGSHHYPGNVNADL